MKLPVVSASSLCLFTALSFVACGSSFTIGNERFSTRSVAATAIDDGAISGVRVTLGSQATRQIDGDDVEVNVTLTWPADSPPPTGREFKLDPQGTYRASVDVDCRCSGLVLPTVAPNLSGRARLDRLSTREVSGWFDVKFTGDIPLTSGGVGFTKSSVAASTAFSAKRSEPLSPR